MDKSKGGLENLEIYKLAERLEVFIHRVTEKFPKDEKYRSVDQLRRSSSSTTDNISESYNRYSYKDKINRMYIARGEAGETKAGIKKAFKKGFVSEKIANFVDEKYTELIKGINGYISYLKKMDEKKKVSSIKK
ncbi:MAG: four helix bundle protein [Patescibacteria group bacterium]